MRKLIISATAAASVLALAACNNTADETAVADETIAADSAAAPAAEAASSSVLNANQATEQQIAGAYAVTPELAAAIVAGRPYANVTALNAKLLETLNEKQATAILKSVFVPVNLNTATEAELKLIPGMTEKMEREFMEYRPYADMSVFDREIGKYVDETEVARFRTYVTL